MLTEKGKRHYKCKRVRAQKGPSNTRNTGQSSIKADGTDFIIDEESDWIDGGQGDIGIPIAPAKKHLGQHFLHNQTYLNKIIYAVKTNLTKSGQDNEGQKIQLVEIGPGRGDLTRKLAELGLPLVCIEKDKGLAAHLQKYEVQFTDALLFDYQGLPSPRVLVSNLPYNVSVPIMTKFLSEKTFLWQTVLVQKEVADRLASKHDTKSYGKLSVLAATFSSVTKHFDIPGTAFRPTTKVMSTLITLHQKASDIDFESFAAMLAKFFIHRRKMLKGFLDRELIHILEQLQIPTTARSGELTVLEYQKIYSLWSKLK